MSPLAAPSPPLGTLAATHGSDRERLSAAAKQFEAIFVRQMLSAARAAKLSDDAFGGSGVDTFREMQDARFADIAAESGALGLAKSVEAQLAVLLSPSRLREGLGEGLLSSLPQQALPRPLPQAGGK